MGMYVFLKGFLSKRIHFKRKLSVWFFSLFLSFLQVQNPSVVMILKKIILAKQLVVTKDEDAGLEAVFQCVRGKKTVSSETEWMDENNTLFSNYVYIFQLIIRTHYFLIGQTRTNIYLSKLDIQISMWYNHRCSIWVTCSSCCHLNSDQALVIFEGGCPWLYKQCPSFEGAGRVFLFVFF